MLGSATNKEIETPNEENVGIVYALQELSECVKWIAELQIYQGSKENTDFYDGDNACGSWYAAKITQIIADKMIEETEKLFNSLKSVITKGIST